MQDIKQKLEKLYHSFDFNKAVLNDPIKFPRKYHSPLDIEISAIISALFSYGSIKCFCLFLEKVFKITGESPADFIINFKPSKLSEKLNLKYRFASTHDIVALLYVIQQLLKKNNYTLENIFSSSLINISVPAVHAISNFVKEALKTDLKAVYGKDIKTKGFLHFFPDPEKGSPCKRLNLFLRWMVRNRDIDFGLWKIFKPSQLIVPLDIHIFKISKKLGLTKKKTQSLKTAIEITDFFRKINPEDPLKYDFIICHGDINGLI